MYRDDSGGKYPNIWQGATAHSTNYDHANFFFVISQYIGQKLEREGDGRGAGNNRATVYRYPSAPWLKQQFDPNMSYGQTTTGFAYTMNETGWNDPSTPEGTPYLYKGVRESDVRRPSKLICVGECMGWPGYGIGYGNGAIIDNENPRTQDGGVSYNPDPDLDIPLSEPGQLGQHHGSKSMVYNLRVSHNMGALMLFYDGHAEWMIKTKGYNWRL